MYFLRPAFFGSDVLDVPFNIFKQGNATTDLLHDFNFPKYAVSRFIAKSSDMYSSSQPGINFMLICGGSSIAKSFVIFFIKSVMMPNGGLNASSVLSDSELGLSGSQNMMSACFIFDIASKA